MGISLYDASVPVFVRMLGRLAVIVDKAAAHAREKGGGEGALLGSRLQADMYPLADQVRIAVDAAVVGAAHLAGVEAPRFADDEASFADLSTRIAKGVAFLESLNAARFEGAEVRTVSWTARGQAITVGSVPYLLNHAMPKFYFHLSMAYAILRRDGVALKKGDFMGKA
ncbi:MAG: DUF1993 domain-containing protein [Burkholderiales bacterium]|nr:DUF1993 domain-containing protein [Burkholderiales bacterium]MBZ0249285.1 DUF1993 domain-containing protein [Burkholderiales bacterium]